jgi:hypothetical protein
MQGTYITISVSDTGIGMTTAQIAHLFKPLYGYQNAGLVIPMISDILHHHHAHVTLNQPLAKGQSFIFIFLQQTPKKQTRCFNNALKLKVLHRYREPTSHQFSIFTQKSTSVIPKLLMIDAHQQT